MLRVIVANLKLMHWLTGSQCLSCLGAGKSTLLNTLTGRITATSGHVTLNGQPIRRQLRRKISYVVQHDVFYPLLTLRETLNVCLLTYFVLLAPCLFFRRSNYTVLYCRMSVCPSICLSVCLLVSLSLCLSICLSVHLSLTLCIVAK